MEPVSLLVHGHVRLAPLDKRSLARLRDCDAMHENHMPAEPTRREKHNESDYEQDERRVLHGMFLPPQNEVDRQQYDDDQVDDHVGDTDFFDSLFGERQQIQSPKTAASRAPTMPPP